MSFIIPIFQKRKLRFRGEKLAQGQDVSPHLSDYKALHFVLCYAFSLMLISTYCLRL